MSAPDSVIVIRLSASGNDKINGRIRLNSQLPHATSASGGAIVSDCYAAYNC
ncbi:hypothetical protein ED352_07665 [Muribaculaceae bacterium Isolate-002 (NCI)]|nr:hypothetical protein ED352_07665 [Muribaculaceae bacterium Isolate-002 (NCI)]